MMTYQPVPVVRRELPSQVKLILGLKVVGCLFALGGSFITLLALNDVAMPRELAHRIAMLCTLASGASLLELLGVAGVWTFKRWGVYTLAGFSMLGFVLRMHAGSPISAWLGVASTVIAGVAIAFRWQDFE
jgi:hypothetical protein